MNKDTRDYLILIFALMLLAGYWYVGNRADDNVQTRDENEVISSPDMSASDAIQGDNVTRHIRITEGGITGLPMTVYQLQEPLLPDARLLDFREYDQRLWFSGNSGLISFDFTTGQWWHITRQHGLPRDTAYQIESVNNGVLLSLYDWKDRSLGNNLTAIFNASGFDKTPLSLIQAKNQSAAFPVKQKLQGATTDVVRASDFNWFCVRGKHAGRDIGFQHGGVIRQNTLTDETKEFSTADGMGDDYCTSIARTDNGAIWVSHWNEEAGLSYLSDGSENWQHKSISGNGIELGGPSVFAKGRYVFIAQQRGLVIYDPKTDVAYQVLEEHGLPGFIVADVQFSSDGDVWATSYRYTRNGRGQEMAGAVRFSFRDVVRMFGGEKSE
jgi:hypothetical protein